MKTRRSARIIIVALVAALVMAIMPTAGAQGSEYVEKSLELRTPRTAAVTAGDTAWVLVQWKALTDVEDFRLWGSGRDGVEVTYPETTRDHTALMQGYGIKKGRVDTMALKVTVPPDARGSVSVDVKFSWFAFGEQRSGSTTITVPVVQYKGDDYQIIDRTVSKGDAGDLWVEITYRGLAPSLKDFRVTVPGGQDLNLYFPRSDYSSLNADSELEDRETDFVRFRIDPEAAEKLAELDFVTSYSIGTKRLESKDQLSFVGDLLGR